MKRIVVSEAQNGKGKHKRGARERYSHIHVPTVTPTCTCGSSPLTLHHLCDLRCDQEALDVVGGLAPHHLVQSGWAPDGASRTHETLLLLEHLA